MGAGLGIYAGFRIDMTISSEPIARANGCSSVRTYTGHGINDMFHTNPNVPHYAKNKAVGTMKAGMVRVAECSERILLMLMNQLRSASQLSP